jgi:dTDP-4-amino-4,6-dideoxygalactose transaminase
MDGIQAAALRIKLKTLAAGNAARRSNADRYNRLLADTEEVVTPFVADYSKPVYHLYVVRVSDRDRLLSELGQRGIACGIHYPKPIHLQDAYKSLNLGPGSFPIVEKHAREILSLPMFPELTPAQIEAVVRELKSLLPQFKGAVAISA